MRNATRCIGVNININAKFKLALQTLKKSRERSGKIRVSVFLGALRNTPRNPRISPENSKEPRQFFGPEQSSGFLSLRNARLVFISCVYKHVLHSRISFPGMNFSSLSHSDPKVVCLGQNQRKHLYSFHGYWLTSFNTIFFTLSILSSVQLG